MTTPTDGRIIGVDFDNTIACYDQLIHAMAMERGLIRATVSKNKKAVRDAIRARPNGESNWRSVQVSAYGSRMHEAQPMPGVKECLTECKRRNIAVYVVSHKTEYANFGEAKVNLRAVAMEWLDRNGFLAREHVGLEVGRVFFEPTRAKKIKRIVSLKATHFVDDLEETFLDGTFPEEVQRILFTRDQPRIETGAVSFSTWWQIQAYLLGGPARSTFAELLQKPVRSVARIGKGRNSRVYRVNCTDGVSFAAKCYLQRTVDGLDRLDVEFPSLRFLWEQGLRCVPRPVAVDHDSLIAAYEYVDGVAIDMRAVSDSDVAQVVSFSGRLKKLAASDVADHLPRASEACFSFRALDENLQKRLDLLKAVRGDDPSYASLHRFLAEDLGPALVETVERTKGRIGDGNWNVELPRSARTLSPSDFGFHNALRRPDGSIVFLDFEYFGQDDPAKMIADFILHPAMDLTESVKARYVEKMLACLGGDRELPVRLANLYPLFGLKWCLILLNEFVPIFRVRREFAADADADRVKVRVRQLERSQGMLAKSMSECDRLSYLTHHS